MKIEKGVLSGLWVFLHVFAARAFIIPDELPSILSVIYSNIPTIKKGTDSRLGWGFRLGDRADFQVLVELGPQIYTKKLGNQKDESDDNNRKRNTVNSLANELYARQQEAKNHIADSEGGKWLQNWRNGFGRQPETPEQQAALEGGPKPGLAIGEIDAKSVIPPDDAVLALRKQLQELAKRKKEAMEKLTTTSPSTTTTEGALDDVEIKR